MSFEQLCIQHIQQLVDTGTLLSGDLVGVNEVSHTAKAKVVYLADDEARERFAFFYLLNNEITWKFVNVKDTSENHFDMENGWAYPDFQKRIVAPIALIMDDIGIKMFGWFTVNELPYYRNDENGTIELYCNTVLPEHLAVVEQLGNLIIIEDRNS